MQANKIARDLALLKREAAPRYKERLTLSHGRFVECTSPKHRNWWEGFVRDLESGSLKPGDFSIADLFESLVPDGHELRRALDPRLGPTNILFEAAGAITSSDFSSITGQIVYNAIMEPLTDEEYPFQKLIPTVSTKFSGEKIAGIAKLGDRSEVVAENEDYPRVGTGEDYIETPRTTKRGLIVPITKEAIFFDQTGELLNRCSKVGESLALSKEKRAIDCLIDEGAGAVSAALGGHRYHWRGTSYGSYVDTPWDNLNGTSALVDWTDIDEVEQLFAGIVDPNTGEPVVVGGATLICGPAKQMVAQRIRNATEIVTHVGGYATSGNLSETRWPNPYSGQFEIVWSRLFATRVTNANYWFYGNPRKYARYMENWPTTVTQAPAGNYEDFNRDIVTQYKASERGTYSVWEPRVMIKSAATA